MPKDTIAFISTYAHPSRDSVESTVREAFPEYQVENIVLNDVVKAHFGWALPNAAYVASEFGAKIFRKQLTLRDGYFRTTYLFRKIRDAMPSVVDPARHVFSFQTQSLYDTRVPGVPHYLYTDHTHLSNLESAYFDRRQLKSPRWMALERTIYENAHCVFTRSHNVSADLVRHYGIAPERVICAYAGANVKVPADFELANDGYANQRILFVGADWERKGGPVLIEAFRDVLRVFPGAHLTIVGAKPELSVPNCTVLGNVPIGELSAHYARSSLFCVPTRLEPFGIAFLEAMLHKLPVVATTEGALPDMVQDGVTGRLVAPGDAPQLAAALIDVLRDPVRCRQLGEAGYKLARERYTWDAVGKRMRAAILRGIMS
ncbi:MAG: glycogen synthase [Gammaproteobacteria bacterium]|jgi:glycosyltransferase involved in cell wall biosynthesis|nr:glycogen synthase [Gammaproteobacteria bacterium]